MGGGTSRLAKRITSVVLSLMMVVSLFATLPLTVGAAEITKSESGADVSIAKTGDVTASGSCGSNATWKLEDGTLTISGTGKMTNFNSGQSPWYSKRSSIVCVELENGITSIGNNAFDSCSNLTSVTIPDSVTSIGEYAFNSCTALTSVTIPNSVTSIGEYAFEECSSSNILIPNSVTSIGEEAFLNCSRLIAPIDSSAYSLLTSVNYPSYRSCTTKLVGTISKDSSVNSVFQLAPQNTGLSAEEKEALLHPICYLTENAELNETITIASNLNATLHLNEIATDANGNILLDSNGNIVDGTPHTLEGSANGALIEVPGNLTIKTTGEGQGGIINDNGPIFDVQDGGSLTIENGVYSEDVSEYIANNKVVGKTGNRYTVLNNNTEDLTPENDNHTFVLDNVDTFERQQLLGVQIRPETDKVSQAMRFVSVVRSDLLRGAKDYGFVLAKGKNVENMRTNKNNILADSDNCLKVSAKGSSNTLADEAYSSNNLNEGNYKYLTAAITDIDDDNAAIGAKLYIERQDGTYVYADYTCVSTMGEVKAMAA